MSEHNLEFTITLCGAIPGETSDQRFERETRNMSANDLPMMIKDLIKNGTNPCDCGGTTKIDIIAYPSSGVIKTTWCCVKFGNVAARYVPKEF